MFNLLWGSQDIIIQDASDFKEFDFTENGDLFAAFMPLKLQMPDSSYWTLPIEPLISISGENIVKMRSVSKSQARGTVKERWAEGDIHISVQGSFINSDMMKYTDREVQKLRQAVTQRRTIGVQNHILSLLNVSNIVVLSYNLPFSKGENVQNWSFEAVSDNKTDLFIKVE